MRPRKWMVALCSAVMVGWLGSNAAATRQAPRAIVAASFKLQPASRGVAWACSGSHGGASGRRFTLHGAETDLSSAPHPELDGLLTARVREVFPVDTSGSPHPGRVHLGLTLRSSTGQIKYVGTADLAAKVVDGHLMAGGLLIAAIYDSGRPSERRLVADIALASHSPDGSSPFVGTLGSGTPPSIAIETKAAC
jgi:hypothetical protein